MTEAAENREQPGKSLLSCSNLSAQINGKDILRQCSFWLDAGELVALIGPNGAGKTTLLRCLAGAVAYSGSICCEGTDIRRMTAPDRAALIGYLPQNGQIHWPMKVRDIVALGRLPFSIRRRPDTITMNDPVSHIMRDCGIDHLSDRIANSLSGGERARVLLARAMATQANVLLADEPLASLDPRYQLTAMEALHSYACAGRGVIAVLHDIAMSIRFADRIVVMQDGRIAGTGPGEKLLESGLLEDVFQVRFNRGYDESGKFASLTVTQKT